MEPSPDDIHRILKSKSCRADCIFPVKTILFPLQLWKLFPHSRCGCSGPFWVESCTIDLHKLLYVGQALHLMSGTVPRSCYARCLMP